ncbi:hypothetical protein CWR43_08450 [Rhizobium sullae]|uniref:Uncharacterized protein n=1 Tax=Rhizobium sullae TaxID=50338 RepID=A0A2N0DDX6_RHISU|nr:hypothetical protein CWR43_08450 [Rhizobium sullae]
MVVASLATGTRDLLLSDTVRMHRALRRAGVTAELHVVEPALTAGSWQLPQQTPRSRRRLADSPIRHGRSNLT